MKILEKIKYKLIQLDNRLLSGHISIGNLTIYGRNAMHWGVRLRTKKFGYICFRLPFTDHRRWYPLYLYFSPNATPWAATFMLGKKAHPDNWVKARIRYSCFGHNFDMYEYNDEYDMTNYQILRGINTMVDSGKWVYQNFIRQNGAED